MKRKIQTIHLLMLGGTLGALQFSIPVFAAQDSGDQFAAATEEKKDPQYELLDSSRKGREKGPLSEETQKEIKEKAGDRDPDSTYLLQELDKDETVAKK